MKAVFGQLFCGNCGYALLAKQICEGKKFTVCCTNKNCKQFGKEYRAPTIVLKKASESVEQRILKKNW